VALEDLQNIDLIDTFTMNTKTSCQLSNRLLNTVPLYFTTKEQ